MFLQDTLKLGDAQKLTRQELYMGAMISDLEEILSISVVLSGF